MALITVSAIIDHANRAVARLATQFRESVRLKGMVAAIAAQAQEIEDAFNVMGGQFRSIDNATDNALDNIGLLVGAPLRGSKNDADYRLRIKAQIFINKSKGSSKDVYAIARSIVSDWAIAGEPILIEYPPASFTIGPNDSSLVNVDAQAIELAQVLNGSRGVDGAKAAGVRAIVMSRPDTVPSDNFFRFSGGSGPSAGFGVGQFRNAYDK